MIQDGAEQYYFFEEKVNKKNSQILCCIETFLNVFYRDGERKFHLFP